MKLLQGFYKCRYHQTDRLYKTCPFWRQPFQSFYAAGSFAALKRSRYGYRMISLNARKPEGIRECNTCEWNCGDGIIFFWAMACKEKMHSAKPKKRCFIRNEFIYYSRLFSIEDLFNSLLFISCCTLIFSHIINFPPTVAMALTSPSCDTTKPILFGFVQQYENIDLCLVPKLLGFVATSFSD